MVDANTGKQVWSLWLGDPLTSAPAVADGRVYTSYPAGGHPSASHVLAAFDLQTGKILWQQWIDSDVQSAPVVAEGKVYASTFGGTVYQLDPMTGELLSARQSRATSAPTIAGGDIHVSIRADKAGGRAQEALATRKGQAERKLQEKEAKYLDLGVHPRQFLPNQNLLSSVAVARTWFTLPESDLRSNVRCMRRRFGRTSHQLKMSPG